MNSSNYFSLILMFCATTAMAKTAPVSTNAVTFREVVWGTSMPDKVEMTVKIGSFLLVRARNLHRPRAIINRTIRVKSRFRLPLDIELRTRVKSGTTLPGYVADWDDSSDVSRRYCGVKMPWGFSGRLKCGKLSIVVDSKRIALPEQKQGKKQKDE